MDDQRDLEVVLRSRAPIIVIETRDELRVIDLLKSIAIAGAKGQYLPLFRWTVTDGLQRLDIELEPQAVNAEPTDVLRHIRAVQKPGIYVLLDFHPFLDDPVHIRLLKDIAIRYSDIQRQLVLMSHAIKLPADLEPYSARFEMSLPDEAERRTIVQRLAAEWATENPGGKVAADRKAYDLLIQNLAGLTYDDTLRLARNAIFLDGAISASDLPAVMQAKYELLNRDSTLQYEYEVTDFAQVGGMQKLKSWLTRRRPVFDGGPDVSHLDPPRGIVLLGVQGCGKSLAAKATAGVLGVPLLRLDFGAIHDKYHGESERKLREALRTADVMSPCVLWIDEIEKGIAGRGGETGTAQRVLGSFLTWLAERRNRVFVVATANDIAGLPPELVRKGRFDEIFFVDLPDLATRSEILGVHLAKRRQTPEAFDLDDIASEMHGFSGAEIEQAVVSALYAAHAQRRKLTGEHILAEARLTRPLSTVMREHVDGLREWAASRTVSAN